MLANTGIFLLVSYLANLNVQRNKNKKQNPYGSLFIYSFVWMIAIFGIWRSRLVLFSGQDWDVVDVLGRWCFFLVLFQFDDVMRNIIYTIITRYILFLFHHITNSCFFSIKLVFLYFESVTAYRLLSRSRSIILLLKR